MNPLFLTMLLSLLGGKDNANNSMINMLSALNGINETSGINGSENSMLNAFAALSGKEENGDKMNMLLKLLPQLMNMQKPMSKEDKYLKEAETMYAKKEEQKPQNTQPMPLEEIKGFSTNEVQNALYNLWQMQN